MAVFINDGYGEWFRFGNIEVEFRPLVWNGRLGLLKRLSLCQNREMRESILRGAVYDRIVSHSQDAIEQLSILDSNEFTSIAKRVIGVGNFRRERDDAKNLFDGVLLVSRFPWFAKVSCDTCRKYWFNPLSGKFTAFVADGKPAEREGQVLCETHTKCPVGHYSKQKRLTAKNRLAFQHYLECKATGSFPDDPIVSRNAEIIDRAMRQCQQATAQSKK